jgi:hypothetical protein
MIKFNYWELLYGFNFSLGAWSATNVSQEAYCNLLKKEKTPLTLYLSQRRPIKQKRP